MSTGISQYHALEYQLIRGTRPQFPVTVERKSGPGYVRYEDLYVAGDDLQDVVNRVTGNRALTFPEGVFKIPNNFKYGYYNGVRMGHRDLGAGCRGFSGSGRNTIFEMDSSNLTGWPSGASPYYLIETVPHDSDPEIEVEHSNYQIRGTNLGHEYHGLHLDRCTGVIDNVYINGITGYDKVPPGETGSISFRRMHNGLHIKNVEIDGRRNGELVASSPIMPNYSSNVTMDNVYVHHTLTGGGGIAWFNSSDSVVNNFRAEYIGSGPGKRGGYGANHEQTTRITYNNPTIICNRNEVGGTLHMSLNADPARGGVDCELIINNPTWDATAVGGGRFCVETWLLDGQMQRTPPKVYDANGDPLEYYYINPYANGGVQNGA